MALNVSTLYGVLLEGPAGGTADALRFYHAQEALADPDWRASYDKVADGKLGFPENVPAVTRKLSTIAEAAIYDPAGHLLAGQWGDLSACQLSLRERAAELGVVSALEAHEVDVLAAGVGAHLWCATVGTSDIRKAAALGHDAVSSLSAVMARSLGEGDVFLAQKPLGRTHPVYQLEWLDRAIAMCHAQVKNQAGGLAAREALRLAVHDLSYRGEGGSVTYQAALRLRDYLAALPAETGQLVL